MTFQDTLEPGGHICSSYCVEGWHAFPMMAEAHLQAEPITRAYQKFFDKRKPFGFTLQCMVRPAREVDLTNWKAAIIQGSSAGLSLEALESLDIPETVKEHFRQERRDIMTRLESTNTPWVLLVRERHEAKTTEVR